jgi:hypothetical protein
LGPLSDHFQFSGGQSLTATGNEEAYQAQLLTTIAQDDDHSLLHSIRQATDRDQRAYALLSRLLEYTAEYAGPHSTGADEAGSTMSSILAFALGVAAMAILIRAIELIISRMARWKASRAATRLRLFATLDLQAQAAKLELCDTVDRAGRAEPLAVQHPRSASADAGTKRPGFAHELPRQRGAAVAIVAYVRRPASVPLGSDSDPSLRSIAIRHHEENGKNLKAAA